MTIVQDGIPSVVNEHNNLDWLTFIKEFDLVSYMKLKEGAFAWIVLVKWSEGIFDWREDEDGCLDRSGRNKN